MRNGPRSLFITAMTLWALGCSDPLTSGAPPRERPKQAESSATEDRPRRDGGEDEPEERPAARRRRFLRSARCGECHEQMRRDWLGSAHARATHSRAYQRAVAALDEAGRAPCLPCHLPGLPFGQEQDHEGRPSEGVSCDGCHTLAEVQIDAVSATARHDVVSGRKYGPLVGPASNYFHGMAQSELHTRSDVCAPCHHRLRFTIGGEARKIPVVTDYSGWKAQGRGKPCQACHMPSRGSEPVARGGKARPDVPSHALPGAAALGARLRLEVSLDPRAAQLTVELAHGAGHMLPSGHADRRLILRAAFLDRGGAEVAAAERSYGIFLVDEAGAPAPFYQAHAVKEDRRLPPERPDRQVFPLPPAPPERALARAVISVLAAPTAPELARFYGEPELTVLKSATVALAGVRGRPQPTGETRGAER